MHKENFQGIKQKKKVYLIWLNKKDGEMETLREKEVFETACDRALKKDVYVNNIHFI